MSWGVFFWKVLSEIKTMICVKLLELSDCYVQETADVFPILTYFNDISTPQYAINLLVIWSKIRNKHVLRLCYTKPSDIFITNTVYM